MAMESRRLRISGVLGPRLHGGRTECLEGSPSEHRGTPVIERSAFRDGITSWPEYRRTGVDFGSAPIPDPNRVVWLGRTGRRASSLLPLDFAVLAGCRICPGPFSLNSTSGCRAP